MEGNQPNNLKYLDTLHHCALYKTLNTKSAKSFLSLFHQEKWPKNTCILNDEKFFFHYYIIVSGRIKMYQVEPHSAKEITLFLLTKSDVFDIFCLLDGCRHNVYYECLDKVKVLVAPMESVREWYVKHPKYYNYVLPYAGKLMRMLENYVSDISFTRISTRLLKLLIKNVNAKTNNLELINNLSNKELAYLIGSTRAVVNRHLQKLKNKGSISLSRNNVQIRDLSLLLKELESDNLSY